MRARRNIQLLFVDGLEPRTEVIAQQKAESKRHLALAVTIDVVAVDRHRGTMPDDPGDRRSHLGRRAALELRVDTHRAIPLFLNDQIAPDVGYHAVDWHRVVRVIVAGV